MNFYTHAAQGRIRGCILKSFIQIPIFVSWSVSPSGRWNGTGAPWCPICGAAGAAHLREAELTAWVFTQNLENAAEMCVLNSLGALSWLLSASSCVHGAHFCYAQTVKRAWGAA